MNTTVQLMATCLVDSLFPEVGEAVLEILERAGLHVEFPPNQTCCGQPAFNAGFREPARWMARHTIDAFEGTKGPVVIPSGSCTAMIRHGYQELFSNDPIWLPRSQTLAARTYEFSEFLVDQLGIIDFGSTCDGRIAYHPSCHLLRDLSVDRQPLALLSAVAGAEVQRLSSDCCGFGGIFAIEHPEISGELLKRRIIQIEETGIEMVTACDVGCLMHLEGGLRSMGSKIRCMHLAQVLSGSARGLW